MKKKYRIVKPFSTKYKVGYEFETEKLHKALVPHVVAVTEKQQQSAHDMERAEQTAVEQAAVEQAAVEQAARKAK